MKNVESKGFKFLDLSNNKTYKLTHINDTHFRFKDEVNDKELTMDKDIINLDLVQISNVEYDKLVSIANSKKDTFNRPSKDEVNYFYSFIHKMNKIHPMYV